MRTSIFTSELWLPGSPETVFPFFAETVNLERITPSWLAFRIVTPQPIEMGAGTLIDYRLRLRGVPLRWRTRIAVWEPPRRFIDEQIRGPYRTWVHEHHFEPSGDGTLCRDRVTYAVPGGWLVDWLFVRGEVERIFGFRRDALVAELAGSAG